jgi:hypothetical protein
VRRPPPCRLPWHPGNPAGAWHEVECGLLGSVALGCGRASAGLLAGSSRAVGDKARGRAGSLAENIGAIVSGEAKPHGVVTYVMAGVTVAMLLATTTWATVLIRRAALPGFCQGSASGSPASDVHRRTRAAA